MSISRSFFQAAISRDYPVMFGTLYIFTLLGQMHEARKPYSLADVQAIRTPTLLIGGADTTGSLANNWRVMAKHIADVKTAEIAGAHHWMFEQDPAGFCRAVTAFLAG